MNFQFGNRSKEELQSCHADLQLVLEESLKNSCVDFGVSEGQRSLEKQLEYFRTGKSKIDGIKKKGKHNLQPSEAADIYVFVEGKPKLAYDERHMAYLAGVITATANRLYSERKISHKVRWGGNWDMNGEIILDQDFDDLPHFELI